MPTTAIHADSILRTVMDTFPSTVAVFVRRRMHCPGCAMSAFLTVAEAARSYAMNPQDLLDDLRRAAAGGRA